MSTSVLILGFLVGLINYLFRYLPLRLQANSIRPAKRGVSGVLLDNIGIASICALLIVSCVPEIMRDHQRLIPTLVGFILLSGIFYKTRSIIISTLLSALGYGLAWKFLIAI